MIDTAEIYLWGTRIGIVHLDAESPYASFEYDRDFVNSGIEVSPVKMPLSKRVYVFPSLEESAFHGVPGLIADSLPDRFGNAVIKHWLASQGRSEADFTVIDRLCYTGKRGMGALEYVPASSFPGETDAAVDVSEMVRFASDVLSSRAKLKADISDTLTYSQLLQMGTSAGGARAKAVIAWNEETGEVRSGQVDIGKGFDYWLMKFDAVANNGDHGLKDAPEYTLIEYAYYKMARAAGINMSECRLLRENGRSHFMTKRFDRVDGKKLHMQTFSAISHISYNSPGLCGYEYAAGIMKQMGLTAAEIEQFFRRMVFNVCAVNQDDHVKNLSFLMDRSGKWTLSPAYDLTFSYDSNNRWLRAHQMTINGKTDHIDREDLLSCGANMGISKAKCRHIIADVTHAVDSWADFASEVGIRDDTISSIQAVIGSANNSVKK